MKKTVFFPIPHTKLVPPKNPNKMVNKNDFRYPVPSQPVTKHSHIPLVHKTTTFILLPRNKTSSPPHDNNTSSFDGECVDR